MKVLYLSNYHESSGYSTAARDYILSLDAVGVDVVPRRLNITGSSCEIPNRILELEKKSDKKPDVIIMHTLPHGVVYTPKAKCICLYAWETNHFKNSNWARHLNLMDEVWVINNQMVESAKESGVKKPIRVMPHAVETMKFQKSYNHLELPSNDFLFYFIGEVIKRKNLTALVQAFHTEFHPREPVGLVIKASVPGISPTESYNFIAQKCNEIKHGVKKFWTIDRYKPELILTDKLSEDNLCSLHRRCNCLVAPSYGEAWCLPVMDSMGFGNPVITSDNTGFKDYVKDIRIPCSEVPVFGMVHTFQDLYTSEETWWEPNIRELQKAMRFVYENQNEAKQMGLKNMNIAFQHSYTQIGKKMKKGLEEILNG